MSRQSHPCETARAPCRARLPAGRRAAALAASAHWQQLAAAATRFSFFVPFRIKSLDAIYIMRDSMKINPGAAMPAADAKEATDGSLFLAARLLDGDQDRAVRSGRGGQLP